MGNQNDTKVLLMKHVYYVFSMYMYISSQVLKFDCTCSSLLRQLFWNVVLSLALFKFGS
jgi:hypothetical protein